jgi:hypothetical protein
MQIADHSGPLACAHSPRDGVGQRTGLVRVVVLSFLFGLLILSGLILEFLAGRNWNSGAVVLVLHIAGGLVFTGLFLSWILGHCRRGLTQSERPVFTWLSWLLLAKYLLLIGTGWLLVVPAFIYLAGSIWFWSFETTYLLTDLHLWLSLVSAPALLLHLWLRHWCLSFRGKGEAMI